MSTASIYESIEKLALPLIIAYREDLTKHDRAAIDKHRGVPFLHFTGDTGTHLVFLWRPGDYPGPGEYVPYLFGVADREHILSEIPKLVRCMKRVNRQALILHFDGKEVKRITQEKAEEIADSYKSGIWRTWRGQGGVHGNSRQN